MQPSFRLPVHVSGDPCIYRPRYRYVCMSMHSLDAIALAMCACHSPEELLYDVMVLWEHFARCLDNKALALFPAHINKNKVLLGVPIFMRGSTKFYESEDSRVNKILGVWGRVSPNFYENGDQGSPLLGVPIFI